MDVMVVVVVVQEGVGGGRGGGGVMEEEMENVSCGGDGIELLMGVLLVDMKGTMHRFDH